MAHFVKFKIGRKDIIMWNATKGFLPRTEDREKAFDPPFIAEIKKAFSEKKKEIKKSEQRTLDYLGINDKKLLNKCVKYKFDKLIKSKDQTEKAIKSKQKIY